MLSAPSTSHRFHPPSSSYQDMSQPPASSSMSNRHPTTASPSNYKAIFESAIMQYHKTTKQDLTIHPLAGQLQACDSPEAILTLLQDQVNQFIQSRGGDERWKEWLNPTVNVLCAFDEGGDSVNIYLSVRDISLIPIRQGFSLTSAIFTGAGVLFLVIAMALVHSPCADLVTLRVHRWPRKSKQAKISSLISSNTSKISFEDLKATPPFHQPQQ
jgi:hypothetical protein